MTLDEQIEWLRIEIERVTFLSDPRPLIYPQVLASLEELKKSAYLLNKLIEFAGIQEKEGLIDGSCDPSIYVESAKKICEKYIIDTINDKYAIQA